MERKNLLDLLVSNKLTLSSMESLTGGLFSSTFTSLPGASQAFLGGIVSYAISSKEHFGVSEETIKEKGAISPKCAKEMALVAAEHFHSDCSVSFTGNAGPEAQEGKPVGLAYVAIKVKDKLYSYKLELSGTRDSIRRQLVDFAFSTLYEKISQSL